MKRLIILLIILIFAFGTKAYAAEVLQPAAGSEVLGEVTIEDSSDGNGEIMRFSIDATEESGGYEIQILPNGEYNAIKEEIPEEIKRKIQEEIEQEKTLELNSITDESSAVAAGYAYPANLVVYLETQEPLGWKLCQTYLNPKWSFKYKAGEETSWAWDAAPSPIDTNWYLKSLKDGGVIYYPHHSKNYMISRVKSWHQNKDFGFDSKFTNVHHELIVESPLWYSLCDPTARANIQGAVGYKGEAYQLLHTHLYYQWISRNVD